MTTSELERPICVGCNKTPDELDEFITEAANATAFLADEENYDGTVITPTEFVLQNEGTLNPANGHFLCTQCYIAAGMPSSPTGWVAP
jgi:hypothetical protein